MKHNSKKIIIFSGIFVFLAILNLVYFFVLPGFINIEKYKPEIREYLKKNVSVPIDPGKLDLEMTWDLGIRIKTDKIFLKNKDGSKFFNIGSSYTEVALLPLLYKNAVIRRICINNPDGNITRLKDGSFDIANVFIKKGKPKYKVELKDSSIILTNYKINFKDEFLSLEKEFLLTGENFQIKRFTPDKFIELEAKGKVSEIGKKDMLYNLFLSSELPLKKKNFTKNKLKLAGDIINFNLNEVKPYINSLSFLDFKTFTGNGKIKFDIGLNTENPGIRKFFIDTEINNLNIIDSKKGALMSHDGDLLFLTSGNFDDKDLYLNNFQIDGNRLKAAISGKISNFANRKIRNADLKIDVDNTSPKAAAEIFPKFIKVTLDPFNKILKHNIDGNISGSITTKGYYRRPELFGKIKYDDLSILKKIPGRLTANGFGTVDFLGPMLVINSKQYITKDVFVLTKGNVIPFKGKKLKLNINSTQNLDFEKALPVLLAIRDIFEFKLTPVTEMKLKGTGKVNLEISGGFKDPKINGYVEVKNASVKYLTLADKAENVNGKVKFTGDKVYYDELSGFVDGLKLIPSGYSTLHGYSDVKLYMPKLDLKTGQKFIYGSPLLFKTQFALKDIIDIKGFADTAIFLKGTEKKLDSKGTLKFTDAYIKYKGYAEPFNKLKGQLRYVNENIFFDNVNGNVLGNKVTVGGSVGGLSKNLDLAIASEKIRAEDAIKFVMNSSLLQKSQKIVGDYKSAKGTAKVKLVLKGNAESDCLSSLVFSNPDITFVHSKIGFPVKISQGVVNITNDAVQTAGIKVKAGKTDFILKGKVSGLKANIKRNAPVIPDLELKINKFDAATVKEALKIPSMPIKAKRTLSKISNFDGFANVLVYIKPSGYKANLEFDKFSLVYKPIRTGSDEHMPDLPLIIENGKAQITDQNAYFSNINGKISNSDFFLNGSIKNYNKNPGFEILTSLKFNSEDAGKLSEFFKQPFEAQGFVPISASIKGNADNWKLLAKMTLNKGTSLLYNKKNGLSDDRLRILSLDAQGKNDRLDIKNLKLDSFGEDDKPSSESPWDFDFTGDSENILHIAGSVDKLKTGRPVFENFKITTNDEKPLSTCVLNPCLRTVIKNGNENFFSEGNIKADLTINGYIFNPDIEGDISFSGLKIPDYKMDINNATLSFAKDVINLDLKDLKTEDSTMNIKAVLDYPLEMPLIIKDINITSDYLNVDKIAAVFNANKTAVKTDSEETKLPYFIIKGGKLNAKELILRDLITSDVTADITFTPDKLLSVSDILMKAAGGVGTGNIYYNTESTDLSLNLNAKNMQANALATTFFRLPGEVYGTLNGEGQFYTKGRNSEEMISNTNGYADFKVDDGHLVRLGSLEYLLRASNILQSGIGGFNVNNIIDIVAPQKTGYFEHLDGKCEIKDGILTTDEITSSGQNLSLFISGNYDMLTNDSNVKVLGKLSKKVSGLLGPIGSVTINQFIDYVPGFGFLPGRSEEKGLLDSIPGLSKIPILGLDGKDKYRQFLVDINGNLYDKSSVKSFKWLE